MDDEVMNEDRWMNIRMDGWVFWGLVGWRDEW